LYYIGKIFLNPTLKIEQLLVDIIE